MSVANTNQLSGGKTVTNIEPAATETPTHPTKLLVADDEHLVASGLAANLEQLGYTVVGPASDGDEAIEFCRTEHPDMALLDIRMSKKDGLTAAETIFQRMGIPVIIFSAYSDPEYVESGNRVGVFGYMLKPVTQDQLRVGVSVAWGRYLDYVNQNSEIHSLKERLEQRKMIEQAKWIIVKRKNLSEPEAMKLLQRQARNNRRTLIDVARSVLENESIFGED